MQTKLGKWLHHLGWGTKTEKEAEKGIQIEGRAGSKRLELCKSTEDIGSKGNWGLALHRVSVWVTEKLDIHFGREEREKWSRKLKENLGSQKFFFHFGCCLGWLKYSYGLRRSLEGKKVWRFYESLPKCLPKASQLHLISGSWPLAPPHLPRGDLPWVSPHGPTAWHQLQKSGSSQSISGEAQLVDLASPEAL